MWSDVEVMKTLKTSLSPSAWSRAYASHNFIIAFEASISSSPSEMHSFCHATAIWKWVSGACSVLQFCFTTPYHILSMIITFCMCRRQSAIGLSLYLQIKGFIIMTVSLSVMLVVIYLLAMIDSLAWTLRCFSSVSVKSSV